MARVLLGLARLLVAAHVVTPLFVRKEQHDPSTNTEAVFTNARLGIRPPKFAFFASPPSQPWRAALLEWRAWPPEPPPPWEGVQWAVGGEGPRRAVVVADAGDGERWLRWLHPLAHAPLLLWRPPAPVPSWLAKQRGYVVAAHELGRLHQMIVNDTVPHVAFKKKKRFDNKKFNFDRIQFDSRSPVVLSLRGISSLDWPSISESWDNYESVMEDLWACHMNFRGILFLQDASAKYVGTFRGHKITNVDWFTIVEYQVASLATEVMKLLIHNLEGNVLPIFRPKMYKTTAFFFRDGKKVKYIEDEILDTLEEKLNFRFMVIPELQKMDARKGIELPQSEYEKGTYKVQETLLQNAITPISTLKFPLIYSMGEHYECIQSTSESSKLLVVVRPAANLPGWSLPLRVFNGAIWGALAATAVAYALAWRVITGDGPLRCVSFTLAALSSCGSEEQSRIRSLRQRLQLAGALLASSVVIAAAYQGRLYSLVAEPEKYPEIETIEQLADTSMPVFSTNLELFYAFVHSTIKGEHSLGQIEARLRILKKGVTMVTWEEIEMMVTERRNVAILVDTSIWKTWSNEILFGRKLHNLKESITNSAMSLVLTKNWPWKDRVEQIILLMKQSGVYQHVDDMHTYVWDVFHPNRHRFTVGDDDIATIRVLQLADVLPHLQLLAAGIVLAALCFAGEHLHQRRRVLYQSSVAPDPTPAPLTHCFQGVPQGQKHEPHLPAPFIHSHYA